EAAVGRCASAAAKRRKKPQITRLRSARARRMQASISAGVGWEKLSMVVSDAPQGHIESDITSLPRAA
ncbi:MAG TPA: hypothetical protein PK694_02145, partial [Rhodospirillales bacterium]|nr:hypothetical protein [Rhodospirillales bacterium]